MKKLLSFRVGLLMIILLSTLLGCLDNNFRPKSKSDQPDLTLEEQKRLILLDANYVYSLDAARHDATVIAAELDAEDAKKGIKVVRRISEVKTYSILDTIQYPGEVNRKNDPGIYIFNFTNNRGFAIISGDERIMGRLGWSDNGKIDNNPNPGIRIFLSRMIPYFQFKRKEIEAMRGDNAHISLLNKLSSFKQGVHEKTNSSGRVPCAQERTNSATPCDPSCTLTSSSYLASSYNTTHTVVPALLQTSWSQYAPYNNLFPSGCNYNYGACYANSNYLAGCVPLSEAQVIAYFYGKNPARFGSDWATIANTQDACGLNSTQVNGVAALVKAVFDHYALTSRVCGGTFTFDHDILGLNGDRGIHPDFGLVQGEWRDYNVGDLRASISNGSPVPVQGSEHEWCAFFNWGCVADPTVMHQWVMDGILTTNTVSTYVVYPVDYSACRNLPSYTVTYNNVINTYTHANWGWGGYTNAQPGSSIWGSNGWYLESAFGDWDITQTNNVYSFNHDDKIIAYVTPN
jgi:hypothetical protein